MSGPEDRGGAGRGAGRQDAAPRRAGRRKAAVLAGAPGHVSQRLRQALEGVDLVMAADAGVALADALGLTPDLWVGDFDSVGEEERRRHAELPQLEHPRDKDELDLELAIAAAVERGAGELVLAGVFDGRLDQTIAALLIAARLRTEGLRVRLFGGSHECRVLAAGDETALALPDGTLFSLLSLEGDAVVDVRGARFELAGARLPYGVGLGVSNRASAGADVPAGPHVGVRSGLVAVVIEWAESVA